jgi:homoserine dehydrogenase
MEIKKNKLEFKDSLLKAKQLGYSESNPTSDLNGEDVASKLKILTALIGSPTYFESLKYSCESQLL